MTFSHPPHCLPVLGEASNCDLQSRLKTDFLSVHTDFTVDTNTGMKMFVPPQALMSSEMWQQYRFLLK
jgi:hypothetical protein